MENKSKNKKRLLILVALVGVMGIGGVVAATSISINAGVPISLGAGYTTATTCDTAVSISATQSYVEATNLYSVSAFNISSVDTNSGQCNNKIMQLAYVTSAATVQASWSLGSSNLSSFIYQFGPTTGAGSGNYIYASTTLTPFDIGILTTVALSIS